MDVGGDEHADGVRLRVVQARREQQLGQEQRAAGIKKQGRRVASSMSNLITTLYT